MIEIANYARGLLAKASQSGWRPAFGWGGGAVIILAYKFAFIDAPLAGLTLSGEYYLALNAAAGLFIGAFIARGVEKQMEIRAPLPGGGLVSSAALA